MSKSIVVGGADEGGRTTALVSHNIIILNAKSVSH